MMVVRASAVLILIAPLALVWLLYLRIRRDWTWARLVFLGLFTAYVLVALGVTLFPIPVEHVLQPQFADVPFSGWVEWRPFTISFQPTILRRQTLPNVLVGIPLGFGAWFVVGNPTWRKVFGLGVTGAAGIEILQLAIGLVLVGFPYRVTDISDFIFNVSGVLIGMALFHGFAWVWHVKDQGTTQSGVIGHVRTVVSGYRAGSVSSTSFRSL